MNDSEPVNFSRDDSVYLANLYLKANLYEKMTHFIANYIQLYSNLTKEEQRIFINGFTEYIQAKRNSIKLLNNIETKKEKSKSTYSGFLNEVRDKIEIEIKSICFQVQELLDKNLLISKNINIEDKIIYLKMRAEFNTYKTEISIEEEYDLCIKNASKDYKDVFDLTGISLDNTNKLKLQIALDYSEFLYNNKNDNEQALNILSNIYNNSIDLVNYDRTDSEFVDLLKLIDENIIFYSNEPKQ